MNKKFFKLVILMTIIFIAFLITSKVLTGKILRKVYSTDKLFDSYDIDMEYKGFEEDDYNTIIKIDIKNNTKYYGSINNLDLRFSGVAMANQDNEYNTVKGVPSFQGQFYYGEEFYDYSHYFAPWETREYRFVIPKSINFNKKYFDTNRFSIGYNVGFYKYQINKNSVFKLLGSRGSSINLENSKEPYVID